MEFLLITGSSKDVLPTHTPFTNLLLRAPSCANTRQWISTGLTPPCLAKTRLARFFSRGRTMAERSVYTLDVTGHYLSTKGWNAASALHCSFLSGNLKIASIFWHTPVYYSHHYSDIQIYSSLSMTRRHFSAILNIPSSEVDAQVPSLSSWQKSYIYIN